MVISRWGFSRSRFGILQFWDKTQILSVAVGSLWLFTMTNCSGLDVHEKVRIQTKLIFLVKDPVCNQYKLLPNWYSWQVQFNHNDVIFTNQHTNTDRVHILVNHLVCNHYKLLPNLYSCDSIQRTFAAYKERLLEPTFLDLVVSCTTSLCTKSWNKFCLILIWQIREQLSPKWVDHKFKLRLDLGTWSRIEWRRRRQSWYL